MAEIPIPVDEQRCPTCRTKIVVPGEEGLVIKNAILRVSAASGQASAKCPRCKTWVDVPLTSGRAHISTVPALGFFGPRRRG